MSKGVIAGVVAVVALLAIGGVVVMNSKNNKTPATSSTSTEDSTGTSPAGQDAPNDTPTPAPASPTTPSSSTPPAASLAASVVIDSFAFSPKEITVKKGTTVTWTNKDSASHTVTGDSTGGPNSELLGNSETYSFTFNTVGTFSYHCDPHPQMTGKVVVTE